MKAAEWINRLKAEKGWESDYRVAQELGLTRGAISVYRSKPDTTMEDETAIKVAEALGEAPALVLIDQAAERSKSGRARAELQDALERMRGKFRAGGGRKVEAAGGKGQIDITSVMPISAPEWTNGPRIEPEYTSYPSTDLVDIEERRAASERFLLQLLANRAAAQSSYRHSRAHN